MDNNEEIKVNTADENKSKKNNSKTIILIVVATILVLAIGIGGGFLLANKDNNNNANATETQDNKQEQGKTSNNDKNENKVVSVVSVEDSNEMVRRQMTIEGRDINNNTVWSYTTLAENIPQEAINRGLKLMETRKGKVYLCDWGRLYILDEQTGKVLAQNIEHNMGAAAVYIFDENDNLYTTSYLAAVDKFDTNAKLLKTTESKIWDEGFYWPKKMTLNGNNLIIDYGDEGKVTVNKDTLEIVDVNKTESNNNSETGNQTISTSNNNTTQTITELTADELKDLEKYLNKLEYNGFVSCNLYKNIDEIDIGMVFYNVNKEISQNEINDYLNGRVQATAITKVTTSEIEEKMYYNTGKKLTDNEIRSRMDWEYLDKYDAFYLQRGDTSYAEVTCQSGTKTNDGIYKVILKNAVGYDTYNGNAKPKEVKDTLLTVKKEGDSYKFISHVINSYAESK